MKISAEQIANTAISVVIAMAIDSLVKLFVREFKRHSGFDGPHNREDLCREFLKNRSTSQSGY
jgi:hypothetical protein